LRDFIEKAFLPWSRDNKHSWRNDVSRAKPIIAYFKAKKMREIGRFNVEQFKKARVASFNGRGRLRASASVDREIQLLSRIFSMAIERIGLTENPCRGVKLLAKDNLVVRYLSPDEQEKLMPFLCGRRAHIADILTIDHHTGMRRTEILTLHISQIDFLRGSIQ